MQYGFLSMCSLRNFITDIFNSATVSRNSDDVVVALFAVGFSSDTDDLNMGFTGSVEVEALPKIELPLGNTVLVDSFFGFAPNENILDGGVLSVPALVVLLGFTAASGAVKLLRNAKGDAEPVPVPAIVDAGLPKPA